MAILEHPSLARLRSARCLEICADSLPGVAAAIIGGADRIELCSALELGGLTPSAGLVNAAIRATRPAGIALHAMVRPRSGGFNYDRDEIALAVDDAIALIVQGVDGLVFGAVRDGQVDVEASRDWISAVRDAAGRGVSCTFHRAIDMVTGPAGAVAAIAELGFDHILTSGGARTALEGADTIGAMVLEARDTPVTIMAGCGVTPDNAAQLLAATGVTALHASASVAARAPDPLLVDMGFARQSPRHTDAAMVFALRTVFDTHMLARR